MDQSPGPVLPDDRVFALQGSFRQNESLRNVGYLMNPYKYVGYLTACPKRGINGIAACSQAGYKWDAASILSGVKMGSLLI
jgi:hypothetical protein